MKTSSVKRGFLACAFIITSYFSFAQSGFIYNAETTTEGVILTNFSRSTVTPCSGAANWRTTQFRSGITNIWRSPHVIFGSASLVTVDFNYKVAAPVGSGTWTISVDLYNSGTLISNLGTVTGTTSTAGSACLFDSKSTSFGTPVTVPLEVRFTVTTTNTSVSASNFVQLDDVFSYFTPLASVKNEPNGLTQPSYTTGTRNLFRYFSNEVYGDVYLTKSTQSATSCPGVSDPDAPTPICALTSVNALHEVKIINKTTGDVTYGVLETFTIPYQAGTWEKAITKVQLEDDNNYYVHYFTVPTVESSGTALYWRTYEVAQPVTSTVPEAFVSQLSSGSGTTITACLQLTNTLCYSIGSPGPGTYLYTDRLMTTPVAPTSGLQKALFCDTGKYRITITSDGRILLFITCSRVRD